jgi:hypothetical protein
VQVSTARLTAYIVSLPRGLGAIPVLGRCRGLPILEWNNGNSRTLAACRPSAWSQKNECSRRSKDFVEADMTDVTFRAANQTCSQLDLAPKSGVIDLGWVRKRISIRDVAQKLDLRFGVGKMLHCWHGERHHNGDRSPSVSIRASTNTIKCFGCGTGPLSPVGLIMDVRGCEINEAARWLEVHFPNVPRIPKGKHSQKLPPAEQVSQQDPFQVLLWSGLFAELSLATKCICGALHILWNTRSRPKSIQISFRALQQFSGVRSRTSVAKGLAELEGVLMIGREIKPSSDFPINETQVINICPDPDPFWELANSHTRILRQQVQFEKELRNQERKDRVTKFSRAREKTQNAR